MECFPKEVGLRQGTLLFPRDVTACNDIAENLFFSDDAVDLPDCTGMEMIQGISYAEEDGKPDNSILIIL